ncbi:THO complex subunit 2 [Typha latifolia]|uniref:THO complex subunit 2 n=1 Tax=Typha latifolia TaxID=4733 RepID=UPI003C2E846E
MSLQSLEFKFVTEERLQEWKNSSPNIKLPDPVPMTRFLYELCWATIRGELPFQKFRAALDSVEFAEEHQRGDMSSVLADIVAHLGQDLTISGDYRSRLVKMAKSLVECSLILPRLLQERCEEEFLWEADLSKTKSQDLKAKEVRVNTRLLYQQTKFNLLREESEGYAKLVTLLCQGGLDAMNETTSVVTISIIKSLIGHFDLDPNRVFDIVLECFELYPENNTFYNLIPIFPKSHAAQILGFKFQYYQRMEVNTPVPSGLFRLAALLVKANFIGLDSIYVHLLPEDDEAFEYYDALIAKRVDEANKIGKINLAATGKDLMDDEKQDVTIDLYTALDMENDAVTERTSEIEKNQKLGLLIGFLSVDDWCHAQILFDRLSRLNPVEHIQICEGLFRVIEKTMSPAYAIVSQMYPENSAAFLDSDHDGVELMSVSSAKSSINLPREFFQMLATAGPYLYRDPELLQKVCRVLKAYYLSSQELPSNGSLVISPDTNETRKFKEARLRVEEALGSCVLPSLQLLPANPAIGQEIWEVMYLLPYEVRYRLYGEWEKDDERMPMVLAAKQIAKLDTRRILKRLAKENLKQLGRMVAKLAHANPMTVLRTIVHQIEAYRDMITPVVDAFKYLTQLEYDMLEYVVIERLAQGGREKLKDDGLNLSDWLQSLASFWGHLCKKYPSMELRGLFQYLVNQLKKGSGIELVLLEELIQQMANVQYTENMTEEQLDSMSGSETLRYQATLFGMTRNNKVLSKSTNRLRDSLLPKEEPNLAIPLLLLIAQHRSMVVINADAPHIKMVSEQFDRCHGTLLQYVDFLYSAISPSTAYAQLIPPLEDLVHKYHLDPEVAFLIYRPVMRLFRSTTVAEICWPLDIIKDLNVPCIDNEAESSTSSSDIVLPLDSTQKPVMWSDLLSTVRTMLPSKAWNSLSPDLYATFWGLTLYDLYVPKFRYESEIAKQHAAIKSLEELSDNSSIAITKRKKDKERIQELLDRLIAEFQKQEQHVASVRRRLSHEKDKWLSSCPDTLKINMEFLQRCIFPRCVFSMPDAVYCAMFVHTLHSLGTPFFNTVNHIDVLICKTLQPMICSCTEFEAGRLGRFLYETLKMAYHWKSDESIYERECGNMPGFAVYYRYPNSQRVAYGQFIKVHWKWSGRITRLLVQCLESTEYLEIRNALIVLTKISGVFPVIRKSGLNLEKRVAKIKGDEREDLKVLATGVAAALAARKNSWVSEEEFGMGHIDLKPTASPAKSLAGNQLLDTLNTAKDQTTRAKSTDGRPERSEASVILKSDMTQQKRSGLSANGADSQTHSSSALLKPSGVARGTDEPAKFFSEETDMKVSLKAVVESETRPPQKRGAQNSLGKVPKQDPTKEDGKSGKSIRNTSQLSSALADRDLSAHPPESWQDSSVFNSLTTSNGTIVSASGKVPGSSSRMITSAQGNLPKSDGGPIKPSSDTVDFPESSAKEQKRTAQVEEQDRLSKRRKGNNEGKDAESIDTRISDKERNFDQRSMDKAHFPDHEKTASDEQNLNRPEKPKDKTSDKYDKEQREILDRPDKGRGDDNLEKSRDRSMERRERSLERMQERTERSVDRSIDKARDDRNKDERNKPRHTEASVDRTHPDERFHGQQNLPPPPPLPPSFVPHSVGGSRREEEADRRIGNPRHIQRLSPKHDEKERRRSEETVLVSQDDAKRRREDDFRERKRDERDGASNKVDDRDRDKGNLSKEDTDPNAASKRRKLKRDQPSSSEAGGEYSPVILPSHGAGISQSFDSRERGERKGVMVQHRAAYMDEAPRVHSKEAVSKINRRETDQAHEREWEEDKRQRTEAKRKHRK